jgi:hypothetical protein
MKIAKVLMVVLAVSFCCSAVVAQEFDCPGVTTSCNSDVTLDPAGDGTPTGPLGSCGSAGVNDSWTTFVADTVNARFRTNVNPLSGTDSEFIVYAVTQGDVCNSAGWTEVGCSGDEGGIAYLGDISIGGLVVGDTYLVHFGHWNDAYAGNYNLTIDCPATGGVCGDGVISTVGDEECDGAETGNCLLTCDPDCTCTPVPTPMLPKWGLMGLALMLVVGGVAVFGRGRTGAVA